MHPAEERKHSLKDCIEDQTSSQCKCYWIWDTLSSTYAESLTTYLARNVIETFHGGYCIYMYTKGVFNLSNQLSNFSRNCGLQGGETKFHQFHELILLRYIFAIKVQK